LKFDSEPIKYYFCYGALTYDVELITKDPGTCDRTVWTHTILVISSWVPECIMEVGRYDVDGILGADPKEL